MNETATAASTVPNLPEVWKMLRNILAPERSFYWLSIVYSAIISLLTLAVPISVQALISSVANTGLAQAVFTLALILLAVLLLSGLMIAMRHWLMERFERRLYARLCASIAVQAVHARQGFFDTGDQRGLFNRYFEIMNLKKSLPALLVGGVSVVLQAIVGAIVVSLYHPSLLAFNIVLLIVVYLIWRFWGPAAIRSAISESHAKYHVADWIEGLTVGHGFFKSDRHRDFAMKRTNSLIEKYLSNHRRHFRYHFYQIIAFIVLYALASAGLLGLGGWLVLQGQLTLGQLVAAELILSAVLISIAQFGTYLDKFYEICVAAEELSEFDHIPQEHHIGENITDVELALTLEGVRVHTHGEEIHWSFSLPAGSITWVNPANSFMTQTFAQLIRRDIIPDRGMIRLGRHGILELDPLQLREAILVIDRPHLGRCTVLEYLGLASDDINRADLRELLEDLQAIEIIDRLPQGFDTVLSPLGDQLSRHEIFTLKFAYACLAQPKWVVIAEWFDELNRSRQQRWLTVLQERTQCGCMIFSRRKPLADSSLHMILEEQQHRLESSQLNQTQEVSS